MESRRSAKPDAEPKYLRVSQAANWMNVSKNTVYRMVRRGELPHRTVAGMIRVPAAAVRQALGEDD